MAFGAESSTREIVADASVRFDTALEDCDASAASAALAELVAHGVFKEVGSRQKSKVEQTTYPEDTSFPDYITE